MDRAHASKHVTGVLVLSLCAGGCTTEFDQRFDEAERLRHDAAARGYEWIDTADLLQQAQASEASGDLEAALALVEQARFQAATALQQAERESEAWTQRVVR
jgi:aryl-alcohol dehydrogenase-like predicted oxidoreductase